MPIQFEILQTPRLLLRAITPELHAHVIETATDAEIMEFFGCRNEEDLAGEKKRKEGGIKTFRTSQLYFLLIDKTTNKVIGGCGYHTWYLLHDRAEIGYELKDEAYKNKGLMKEAIVPIINYGFEQMNLHRIEALVGPTNTPSLKLMEYIGFMEEGRLREHYQRDSIYEDSLMFSLLKTDWLTSSFFSHLHS